MWFQLNTTFSTHLGALSTLQSNYGVTYSLSNFTKTTAPDMVEKDKSLTVVLKMVEGATFSTASMTDGTNTVTGSLDGLTVTMTIAQVKGPVTVIARAASANGGTDEEEPETPVDPPATSTPTLVQGYVSGESVNNELATRVRIDGLVSGAFSVECNDGYLIRVIQECASTTPSASDANIVVADDKKTSYSGGSAGKYYAIIFCKTNASSNISPTEDIIKSFSGTIVAITSAPATDDTDDTVAGTDVPYTLVQGAHVQNDTALYQVPNRVTTPKAIKGKFTVTVNSGYAIRAVYEYTKESGDTKGTMVAETSETRTTFTSSNDNKYYGVTFTLVAPNAANDIAPTENIVASWKYV